MKKTLKLLTLFVGLLTIGLTTSVAYDANSFNNVKEASAATKDYSTTVRVYVDLEWGLSSIEGEVGSSGWKAYTETPDSLDTGKLGKYYMDGSTSTNLETVKLYFTQDNGWTKWHSWDDHGTWDTQKSTIYSTFKPGYYYKITDIAYKDEGWEGEHKFYTYSVQELGQLPAVTVNITYNNGGHGTAPSSTTATVGSSFTLAAAITGVTDYIFDGWSDGSTIYDAGRVFDPWTSKNDTTFTAQWHQKPAENVTASFYDGDGKQIHTQSVTKGAQFTYNGPEPTKTSTAQYSYTWDKTWSPALGPINADTRFDAQFSSTIRSYTITWKDGNNSTLKTESLNYGTTPSYTGAAPTKNSTTTTDYTWNYGWTPTISSVSGDATYTATFNESARQYSLSWAGFNDSDVVTPGTAAGNVANGATITAPILSREGYTYTWSPSFTGIMPAANTTYTAQWQREEGYYIDNFTTGEMTKMSLNGASNTEYKGVANFSEGDTFKVVYVNSQGTIDQNDYYGWETVKYDTGDTQIDARSTAQMVNADTSQKPNIKANLHTTGTEAFTIYFDTAGSSNWKIYIPSRVTVNFDLNGKTGTGPDDQVINSRDLVTEPTDPEAEGYSFEGWYSDAACTDAWDFSAYQVVYFNRDSTTHVCTQKIYAKWVSTASVDITLNKNGGTGGPDVIEDVKVGDEISIDTCPTKTNNTFTGYFTASGTKVINDDGTNAAPYEEGFGTTLNAGWQLDPGVYLWLKGDISQDGARKMSLVSGTYYVFEGITLNTNDEIRPYYDSTYYGDIKKVEWTHPSYQGSTNSDGNCVIQTPATYNIYFDTTTGLMKLEVPSMPTNGYYIVVNGETGKDDMYKAIEWSGYTGTEYKATVPLQKDDMIRIYFQDDTTTNTRVYDAKMSESVKVWEYTKDLGLKCPEEGTYSIYIIRNPETGGYDLVSVYQEGEEEAIIFAVAFNDDIGGESGVCRYDGTTNITTLAEHWIDEALLFAELSEVAKATLKAATTASSNGDLAAFAGKYDYVYGKYKTNLDNAAVAAGLQTGNFANRTVIPMSQNSFGGLFTDFTDGSSSNPTLIIVISSVITGLAIGGYFLLRRRKED